MKLLLLLLTFLYLNSINFFITDEKINNCKTIIEFEKNNLLDSHNKNIIKHLKNNGYLNKLEQIKKYNKIDIKFKNCYGNKKCQENIFTIVENLKSKLIEKQINEYWDERVNSCVLKKLNWFQYIVNKIWNFFCWYFRLSIIALFILNLI